MSNKIDFTDLKKNIRELMKSNGIPGLALLGVKALGAFIIMFLCNWLVLLVCNIPAAIITGLLGDNKIAVAVTLLFTTAGTIFTLILTMFFMVGMCTMYKNYVQTGKLAVLDILGGFKVDNKLLLLKTMGIFYLLTYLGTLLCFVPGIIYSWKRMFVPFILSENPDMTTKEIMELSKEMTNGIKMDMFVACISTLGWYFLAILTSCLIVPVFIYVVYTWSIVSGAYVTKLNEVYGDNTETAEY